MWYEGPPRRRVPEAQAQGGGIAPNGKLRLRVRGTEHVKRWWAERSWKERQREVGGRAVTPMRHMRLPRKHKTGS